MRQAGERIGAILSADTEEVRLLGYGVYAGEEAPPHPGGLLQVATGATTWEEVDQIEEQRRQEALLALAQKSGLSDEERSAREAQIEELSFPRTNPKLLLDSGKVVWGFECWWGSEEKIRDSIGSRRVVDVDIDEVRARSANTEEALR